MKVSLNWVKIFLDFDLPPVDELVEKIGAQLGGVDEVVDLTPKYQGIVIAKVVKCEPLKDSDHLKACRIDDGGVVKDVERGDDGLVQVVCGAPNVREGLMVAWLPPGSTVPASFDDAEPFVLSARDLRGAKSNGMLASAKELALSDNHDGLLEIDGDIKPGDDFALAYGLNDVIIDIENKMFTHRPDLFGQLGVAREIAGILNKPFKSPEAYLAPNTTPDNSMKLVEVRNELPELVPRLMTQVFTNVKIGPSPVWLQAKLARLGLRPINNVVDLTNYFMLLTGQPFHAYDLDKLKAVDGSGKAMLVVRPPRPGEKLTLINGKEVEPSLHAITIASGKKLIGVGGVMGGSETEVDNATKNILLECATFDMYAIRRASMALGVFSDAVTRFSKGQSPLQNDRVMAMITKDLAETTGATPGEITDLNELAEATRGRDSLWPPVVVTVDFINERLGAELTAEAMQQLLANVEFDVTIKDSELSVHPPFWRTDIELREDVVEEIGRLYGYDRLPLTLPSRNLIPAAKNPLLELKQAIRDQLAKAGANETLNYSFVHGDLLDKVGQHKAEAYSLSNALSPDLQYYRLSLTPSLLEKVHPNAKAGYSQFALFEIGKGHKQGVASSAEPGLPHEEELLALTFAADSKAAKSYQGAPFYQARKYLESLFNGLGQELSLSFEPFRVDGQEAAQVAAPFDPSRTARVLYAGVFIGFVGEYRASVLRSLKLPAYTAGFEIELTELLKADLQTSYLPLFRFPSVKQDITLKVAADKPYADIYVCVDKALGVHAPDDSHIALELSGIYQAEDDQAHKNYTFRVTITGQNRTLTDKEVTNTLDAIAIEARDALKAERI